MESYYENILVDIPKKKKFHVKFNQIYVAEIFARKGKKNEKDDIHIVGRLAAGNKDKMHPNEYYFQRHPEQRPQAAEEEDEEKVFSECLSVGDYLLFSRIADDMRMRELLDAHFQNMSSVILAYATYILYMQDSSIQNYDKFAFGHYCGLNYIPTQESFTRLLSDVMTRDAIRSFMSDWLSAQLEMSGHTKVTVDFDSSNGNTAGTEVEYAEDGKPKQEEELPQVNWVSIVDRETGVMIYMDVFYGSLVDMNHCATVLEKVKSILSKNGWKKKGISKNIKKLDFTICFDRGYYNSKIMSYMSDDFHFVMLGKDSLQSKELIEAHPRTEMNRSENRVDKGLYGIRVDDYVPYRNMTDRTYYAYLFYRPMANAVLVDNAEDRCRYIADKIVGHKDLNGGIVNTYGNFLDIKVNRRTKIIESAALKHQYIDDIYNTSGYFYLVSNVEMTCKEAYEMYKQRDVIEKGFMQMKSLSDGSKTHAHSTDIYEARTFVSAICSMLRAHILHTMKPYFFQYSSETSESVIREVGKVCIQKVNGTHLPMAKLTKKIRQIFSFFGLGQKDVDALAKQFQILGL